MNGLYEKVYKGGEGQSPGVWSWSNESQCCRGLLSRFKKGLSWGLRVGGFEDLEAIFPSNPFFQISRTQKPCLLVAQAPTLGSATLGCSLVRGVEGFR